MIISGISAAIAMILYGGIYDMLYGIGIVSLKKMMSEYYIFVSVAVCILLTTIFFVISAIRFISSKEKFTGL